MSRSATESDIDDLHRRAAAWLEANGYVEDALRHAIAGRDWDCAVRLLEVVCAELFERDQIATLRYWLQGIPPHVLATSPQLAFWLAWAQGRTGRWAEGSAALRIAEEAWAATGDRTGEGLVLLWHAVHSFVTANNHQAIELAQRALDFLPMDRPTERIFALMTQGVGHLYHGESVAAEVVFSEAQGVDRYLGALLAATVRNDLFRGSS